MEKRAQFFLLAAVIISAVIISLSVGTNRVVVKDDPDNFYDYGYEVKREVGAALDYSVYKGFDSDEELEKFIGMMAEDIADKNPGSQFVFIYGNKSGVKVLNYGSDSVYADDSEIAGIDTGDLGEVCLGGTCRSITGNVEDFEDFSSDLEEVELDGVDEILIRVGENKYPFPLTEYKQVIFIMQKNVDGERHVVVG